VPIQRDHLIGRWVHSHEEDTDSTTVFRPASYEFPPSRGRRAFELRSDGTLVDTAVGAADVPESSQGRWALDGDVLVLEGRHSRVVLVEPDRLVLEK
jgi:hypothetical protein